MESAIDCLNTILDLSNQQNRLVVRGDDVNHNYRSHHANWEIGDEFDELQVSQDTNHFFREAGDNFELANVAEAAVAVVVDVVVIDAAPVEIDCNNWVEWRQLAQQILCLFLVDN